MASAREHFHLLDLMLAGGAREAENCMRRHLAHIGTLWADGQADGGDREPALRLGGERR